MEGVEMTRNCMEMLAAKWAEGKHLCVGLDDPERALKVIEETAHVACAFKANRAFWTGSNQPPPRFLSAQNVGVPVILDAKYGDIASSNEGYAREAFDFYGADAVTVSPYLGGEALEPFFRRKDKLVLVLCRTSNPGAKDLQERLVQGKAGLTSLYGLVARSAREDWNINGNVGLVVGATDPKALALARHFAPDLPILVPGIGAQGGDLEAVVKAGGDGLLINASRSISNAESPKAEAERLDGLIQQYRAAK